jgi:protein-tyrosine phosphatase
VVRPSLVIVGGSIIDNADWLHLRDDYNVRSVLNVETEHTDEGKGIPVLSECRVPDDGTPFPFGLVRHAVSFAHVNVGHGPIYVHCQQGGSRSPAFAYAVLRWVFGMSKQDALQAVRTGKDDWSQVANYSTPGPVSSYGHHSYHRSYIDSVDSALAFDRPWT